MNKPHQLVAKAETYYSYFTKQANAEARRLLQQAVDMAPKLGLAHAELAYAELTAWLYNWDPKLPNLDNAMKHAQAAVDDERDYYNLWILADVHLYRREFDEAAGIYEEVRAAAGKEAIEEERRAVHVDWADMLLLTGQPKKAIELVETAIKQSPVPERWFHWVLGWAFYADEQYGRSLEAMRCLGNPRNAMRKNVIAALVAIGDVGEARRQARKFLEEEKSHGTSFAPPGECAWAAMAPIEDRVPFQDPARMTRWKEHLEAAFKDVPGP